ncbi:MAG: hypothetical protein PHR06_00955 [Candidatus Cloacimonetes bacterium]|nr:hypothetical protein [Candidatus Cloacimonadota bacterium]
MKKEKLKKVYINERDWGYLDMLITQQEEIKEKILEYSKNTKEAESDNKLISLMKEVTVITDAFTELAENLFQNPLFDLAENELIDSAIDQTGKNEDSYQNTLVYQDISQKIEQLAIEMNKLDNYLNFVKEESAIEYEDLKLIRENLKKEIRKIAEDK